MRNPKSRSRKEIDDVVEEFRRQIVRHARMADAEDELMSILCGTPNKPITYLVGPTGVGKTRLIRICIANILKQELAAMKADPSYVPVVFVELRHPERGIFDWVLFYRDILKALNEPMLDKKRKVELDPQTRFLLANCTAKTPALSIFRDSADSAMTHRRLQALFIDEAQHVLRVASNRGLRGQLDTIKTRASLTGVKHVLSGTYELLDGLDLSGQLSRRRNLVHIPRYFPDLADDRDAFASALDTLAADLPLKLPARFLQDLDLVFLKTLGCVGVLKDWLCDALRTALERGDRSIGQSVLENRALTNRQLAMMLEEISQGESSLGGPSNDVLLKEMSAVKVPQPAPVESAVKQSRRRDRRRPGTRNPVRDPVGVAALGA
ncbi:MAG TPA: ATP-binding protein [Nevskiales bacterium]|nr:ATP-binding protein [Nevskiales bacterium]